MDMNPARRKRERAIAHEVAAEFLREIKGTQEAASPELLAHHFGLVCRRRAFVPSETEARRVFGYVSKEIARKRREAEQLSVRLDERVERVEDFVKRYGQASDAKR